MRKCSEVQLEALAQARKAKEDMLWDEMFEEEEDDKVQRISFINCTVTL